MHEKSYTNSQIVRFVVIICLSCALILSLLAQGLEKPQKRAQEVYQAKQMLIAARLLTPRGNFPDGSRASESEILDLFTARVTPHLTNDKGDLFTFEEAGINETEYRQAHSKTGFARLPYKLIYIISGDGEIPYAYVIPINGYGLWDAIYGYLALSSNADTVLGTTWYDQKETPGLGAEIGSAEWQEQFYNKVIFQKNEDGETNFQKAPMGFNIVKTTVAAEIGDRPIAESSIDGVTGASATMKGVAEAYQNSLTPYRPFLIKAHEKEAQ